jgi:PhnB protein
MRLDLHLSFSGECQKALEFYRKVFGGDLSLLSYSDSPAAEQVPTEWRTKIVHGTLKIDDAEIAGADIVPEQYERPKGFQVLVQVDDVGVARRLFDDLSEGGTITMALQETFWSPCYGILVDRFGVPWEVNCAAKHDA